MEQGLLACALFIFVFMHVGPCHGSVRLVNGTRSTEGRLEVFFNGTWGTVCDDFFDVIDAKTVCQSLGFGFTELGEPTVRPLAYYGQGSGPIWLDDVSCNGSQSDILQCAHNGLGIHNCGHYEDVGIDCSTTFRLQLVGGERSSAGRVEIGIEGRKWGTVCDDLFDINDAKVVCRMLGYTSSAPVVHESAYYGEGSGQIWLDDLQCFGNETNLLDCQSNLLGEHNCQHSEDVGVDCNPGGSNNTRLVAGSRRWRGRVEVYSGGVWGTVCDNGFGVNEARVVCRMLGYSYTGSQSPVVKGSAYYGQGSGSIHLEDVTCQGWESSIFDCSHRGLGVHSCSHSEDVGVDCLPPSGPSRVTISGPAYFSTDGSKPLTLVCKAEDFIRSVSFSWTGIAIFDTISTSTVDSTITFTPAIAHDGNTVKCTSNNTENTTLSVHASYILNLYWPPMEIPVIIASFVGDTIVEGSDVTLICIITGGKPLVTDITISCQNQGRRMTAAELYTVTENSVVYRLTINQLKLEDDGTVCQCTGNWTTQPNMYRKQASMTLRILAAIQPDVSLTLNGEEQSLTVNATDNTSVTLTCKATGRPKPSLSVVRVDTRQPLEADTFHTSGQDEDVQQYTLTTSAHCQDAANYTCRASNRAGESGGGVTLYVNCAPELAGNNSDGRLEKPLIIKAGGKTEETSVDTPLQLIAYPPPTWTRPEYLGPVLSLNSSAGESKEIESSSFHMQCVQSQVLYIQQCVITIVGEDLPAPGYYRLAAVNAFGDVRVFVKLEVIEIVPDTCASSSQNMAIYAGAGAGAAGLVLIIVVVVVVVVVTRRRVGSATSGNQIYDRPGPRPVAESNSYSDLAMSTVLPRGQSPDEVYDNAALETENPGENTYVNVGAVTQGAAKAKLKGKAGKTRDGQGVAIKDATVASDVLYENTVLR